MVEPNSIPVPAIHLPDGRKITFSQQNPGEPIPGPRAFVESQLQFPEAVDEDRPGVLRYEIHNSI